MARGMTGSTSRGMTRDELLTLPASITPEVAFQALGLGRTKGYDLLNAGELPVRALKLGATSRIVTADVLNVLGIDVGSREPQGGA